MEPVAFLLQLAIQGLSAHMQLAGQVIRIQMSRCSELLSDQPAHPPAEGPPWLQPAQQAVDLGQQRLMQVRIAVGHAPVQIMAGELQGGLLGVEHDRAVEDALVFLHVGRCRMPEGNPFNMQARMNEMPGPSHRRARVRSMPGMQ